MTERGPSLQRLRDVSILAAHTAGRILRKHFGKSLFITEKAGAGLVTNADTEAEKAILKILRKAAPGFSILAEESHPEASRETGGAQPSGRWIIDPLDGTTNFVHGYPTFCVSIAAEWEGEVVTGVIYHPILRDTYVAVKGKGAFVNGRRMRASRTRRIKESLLTTGFTYSKDYLGDEMRAFENLSRFARGIRRPGSAALDLAYTARGNFDGFWELNLSPWDVAAGGLMVLEAGGRVTDFHGKPFDIFSRQIVASNSVLHGQLLKVLSPRKPSKS